MTNILEVNKNIKIIYISSINIYGNSFPVIYPCSLYGISKYCCERICRTYEYLNNLQVNIIRPCAVVGKNTTHGLFHDVKKKLQLDLPYIELRGEKPGSVKPYVNIQDILSSIKFCIENEESKDRKTLNVFPKDQLSVQEVVELVMKSTNTYKEIRWLGQDFVYKGDNSFRFTKENSWHDLLAWDLQYKTSREAIETAIQQ